MNRVPSGWWILPAILISSVMWSAIILAETIDPSITPTKTLNCDMPVERTDGTPLALNEIAQIRFYVSTDQATWQQAGTNTVCLQVYDLSDVADGTYWYTADAVDTEGRESIKSPQAAELIVKRLSPPASPTGLGWTD